MRSESWLNDIFEQVMKSNKNDLFGKMSLESDVNDIIIWKSEDYQIVTICSSMWVEWYFWASKEV